MDKTAVFIQRIGSLNELFIPKVVVVVDVVVVVVNAIGKLYSKSGGINTLAAAYLDHLYIAYTKVITKR